MTRINAPLLNYLDLHFFYQPRPVLDISQVPRFINCTKHLKRPDHATVEFRDDTFTVDFKLWAGNRLLTLVFSSTGLDKRISLLKQICTQCSPILSNVDELALICYSADSQPSQQEAALLLEVLRLFNAVDTLWIDGYIMETVLSEALESVACEGAAEVLPVLDTINVRGKWQIMSTFIDARWEMGHPVRLKWVNI
jgi:hypothetical protein